ncbi:6023_t:CDS:10 [Entrophospora sp. SA101]|nr:7567_t:CDS:10 [Entrophospora sp. SA101]CAJ0745433.1 6023_t:CDS:10 [Entrophospora sp. SA101]CAJ0825809.1 9334_t:CDS:10 [Entrophospora sp. SA101]CAJ0836912.1 10493_t:CDS:10 [Entrophospora sp. SA101]
MIVVAINPPPDDVHYEPIVHNIELDDYEIAYDDDFEIEYVDLSDPKVAPGCKDCPSKCCNGSCFINVNTLPTDRNHTTHNPFRPNFGPELVHRKYFSPSIKEFGHIFRSQFHSGDPKEIAINFVEELHPHSNFIIKNIYRSEHTNVTHVYFKQVINGITVTNGDLNINIDKHGSIISTGDSFALPKGNAELYNINFDPNPIISPYEALTSFASLLNLQAPEYDELTISTTNWLNDEPTLLISNVSFALSDVVVKQSYLQLDTDHQLQLIWELQIEMENNWYHAHIDAYYGNLLSLIDWVSDATYNVFPLGLNDPSEGSRKLVTDPNDVISSPYGWHSQGPRKNFTTTIGNNVYAHENFNGEWDWDGGNDLLFDYPLNLSNTPKSYIDSAVSNLFYLNNMIHDLFYRYGFNEVAGNFQENNYGKGGKDHDAVIANAQDGSGYNNANFATPPDGQHGKMRMYVWDVVDPLRDGDLEAGIVIHEYSHGISTRLTGGPANSGCLGWGEAGGMGEGWGDFFATILRMKEEYNRSVEFGMGEWANGGEGIRAYPVRYWGVHAKGAVWAGILYEVYWNLVDKLGFTSSWFPPTDEEDYSWYDRSIIDGFNTNKIPKHGNTLFLQLVVDGMKLQPCRPTFINARDAILQADEILTGGENKCEIWKGFAKRGLGVKAKLVGGPDWGGVRKENFDVPTSCSHIC